MILADARSESWGFGPHLSRTRRVDCRPPLFLGVRGFVCKEPGAILQPQEDPSILSFLLFGWPKIRRKAGQPRLVVLSAQPLPANFFTSSAPLGHIKVPHQPNAFPMHRTLDLSSNLRLNEKSDKGRLVLGKADAVGGELELPLCSCFSPVEPLPLPIRCRYAGPEHRYAVQRNPLAKLETSEFCGQDSHGRQVQIANWNGARNPIKQSNPQSPGDVGCEVPWTGARTLCPSPRKIWRGRPD